ncbi:MAG: PD40 domain-containing protein, partial [Ignavibacterium sp.]
MLRIFFQVTILFILLINIPISSQDNIFTSYDLQRLRYVKETSISPDGKFIAYTVLTPRPLTDGPGKHYEYLFIYDLEESKSYGVVGTKVNVKSIGWTADSKHITFLAKLGTDRYTQIYQVPLDGGDPRKITNTLTSVIKYQLSSNGYDLAYTSYEVIEEKKREL